MNAQEAILKIKALFEDNVAPVEVEAEVAPMVEETKVEMAEYSLMDGTKVEISALEIGGSVTLADGTTAPMGEHELMDGTQITLDENGIIIAIESKVEEVVPEAETEVEASKEEDKKMAEMAEQFEAKFAELVEAKEAALRDAKVEAKKTFVDLGFKERQLAATEMSARAQMKSAERPRGSERKPTSFKDIIEIAKSLTPSGKVWESMTDQERQNLIARAQIQDSFNTSGMDLSTILNPAYQKAIQEAINRNLSGK